MTAADEIRRHEHDAKLHAWRIENRRSQGLPAIWHSDPATVAVPTPAPVAVGTAAHTGRREGEAAAAAILAAYALTEPVESGHAPSAAPNGSPDEAAVEAIMAAFRETSARR